MKLKLDKRKKTTKIINKWFNKYTASAAMWGLIIGSLFGCYLASRPKQALSSPLGQKIEFKVEKVMAQETRDCTSLVGYIRCASQDAGLSDKDGSMLIKIARAESGCNINPLAKNGSSTARGSFQIIIGTWEGNDCDGKRTDHKSNTNCAIKIYKARGTQPWETSAHQKSGNGWADKNQCYKSFNK